MSDFVTPEIDCGAEPPEWAKGLTNVASPRLGARGVASSDESFAPVSRMLADAPAVFKPGVFDDYGKWMDGWETKRRRRGGHDWAVLRLGAPAKLVGADLDTSYFTGNFPPAASIWASASVHQPIADSDWTPLTGVTELGPSAHHFVKFAGDHDVAWRWIRLNIFPDGGVARLRLFGRPSPDWPALEQSVELSGLRNGGRILAYNDAHYGDVDALLTEGRGKNMGDGWETRRRREPGADWILIALGAPGRVERIEVDTAHFKGNYPDACSVQAALALDPSSGALRTDPALVTEAMFWPELTPRQPLSADSIHHFHGAALVDLGVISHVRLTIHPDGGVSRFRVFGHRAP